METSWIRDTSAALKAFNNPDCSDVVFIVNDTKYYAYRKYLAGASSYFQSLLEGKFRESSQREISLDNITFESNFLVVLKYIYGFKINLKEISIWHLLELLHLAEYFDLPTLVDKVQAYLDSLKFYDMELELVSTLINLAAQKSFKNLYKTAETFIFANVEQFLTQPSFRELEYDVLKDLLKSDAFYANEFNIFMAVLKWYDTNSTDITSSDAATSDVVDDADESHVVDDADESDVDDADKTMDGSNTKLDKRVEVSQNVNPVTTINKYNKLANLIKEVRSPQVDFFSACQFFTFGQESSLYKVQLILSNIFSRVKGIKHSVRKFEPVVFPVSIDNIERVDDGCVKSGVYLIKNMKWRLKVQWSKQTNGVNVFLKCSSDQRNWTCEAACNVEILTTSGTLCATNCLKYAKYYFSAENAEVCKVPLIALDHLTKERDSYLHKDGSFKIIVSIKPEDPIFQ